jgi:CRP-like cAMP-binding protein/ActR/RegA family two-component response regulator
MVIMENQKTKVLIIEDNNDVRESTCEILGLAGYQTYQANNGKVGVEMALKCIPDIILCDIQMPDLDGYGVLHLLSKQPSASGVPFIFLTSKTERADMRKGMEMGADDYLTKPFDDIDLLNAIECRLKKRSQQKEHFSVALNQIQTMFTGLQGLTQLKKITAERKLRHVKRRQVIYFNGDHIGGIYLVISGSVRTFKLANDGRELLTGIYTADEYFGVAAMLANAEYQETAEAVEDAVICMLPKDTIEELIGKYPDVAGNFIKLLANNVLHNEELLLQLAYYSVRKRMAELLVRLKQKYGENGLSQLDLSRENLAAMAGIATETVSRVLGDFKEGGLISRNGNQITILNTEKLANMKN